jgi:hypothetical protein
MKHIITFTLLILFLSACAAPVTPAPTAAPPAPVPTATPFAPVSAEELNALIADITVKMQQAVEEADPVSRIQFEVSQRAQVAADMFARSLTDAENPADRVLDPNSFSIGISPDGIAYLILEVDSIWGKAHEVAIIDTGADKGMFVTLAGAGLEKGQLLLDVEGYYAAAKDENGQIAAVVDNSRQWVRDIDGAEKIKGADITSQLAQAYLDGRIAYPKGLTAEEQVAFDSIVAEAEASLPYEQQKKLIENRFEKGSKAFEALVKADGNLEYYDGSWKTLEAMRNANNEIIPWGESYDVVSDQGRAGLLKNVFAGNQGALEALDKDINLDKKDAEKKGLDSNFNFLYVQWFPDINETTFEVIGKKIGYDNMEGLIIVKDKNNKPLVVEIKTNTIGGVLITYPSGKTISHNPSDLTRLNFYDLKSGFLAIPSANYLSYEYNDLMNYATDPVEQTYLQKIIDSNLENTLKQLEENPKSLSAGPYSIRRMIFISKN